MSAENTLFSPSLSLSLSLTLLVPLSFGGAAVVSREAISRGAIDAIWCGMHNGTDSVDVPPRIVPNTKRVLDGLSRARAEKYREGNARESNEYL